MEKHLQFRKQRDLGEIITDTFTFLRQHAKPFFTVFFKHVGPLILITTLLSAYLQYSSTSLVTDTGEFGSGSTSFDFVSTFIEFSLVGILNLIAALATYAMSISCVLYAIKSVMDHGEIIETEIVGNMRRKFWSFIGATFLSVISAAVGALFCLLPGIYLAVVLSLIFSVMVFHNISVVDAYSECFKLIKENWWMTFLTLIVIGIMVSIASGIFQLPLIIMGIVEGVSSVQTGGQPDIAFGDNWLYIVFYVISTIVSYVFQIVTIIATALIYFNLDEFHNHTGQLQEIDKLGE